MRFVPKIKGVIDRRILVNYRVEIEALRDFLPAPFEPIDIDGFGMAGICLIRLKEIRPIWMPKQLGIKSENGAHRIAVKWKKDHMEHEGVFIPRRDTSSYLNSFAGGLLFPGEHHLSQFNVVEKGNDYSLSIEGENGPLLSIKGKRTNIFPSSSIFKNLEQASSFFEKGSLGYSPNGQNCFDGLELKTKNWKTSPLEMESVQSTFFENSEIFPAGSVVFDNALLMEDIEHEWISRGSINGESV